MERDFYVCARGVEMKVHVLTAYVVDTKGADADDTEGRIQIRKTHFLTGSPAVSGLRDSSYFLLFPSPRASHCGGFVDWLNDPLCTFVRTG